MVCFISLEGIVFVCLRISLKLQIRVVLGVESVNPDVICLKGRWGAGQSDGLRRSKFLGPEASFALWALLHQEVGQHPLNL